MGDGPVGTLQESGISQASINIRTVITINSKAEDKAGLLGGCRRKSRRLSSSLVPLGYGTVTRI